MIPVRKIDITSLQRVQSESWVDQSTKIFVDKNIAYIPVRKGYPYELELPPRKKKQRGFQRVGDIILFHGPCPTKADLFFVINTFSPTGVLWIHGHRGITRKPVVSCLYGYSHEITHKEAGIVYRFDPTRVMFSQGNREEKQRVAKQVIPGERTIDMFAGIGYFALHLAKMGADVEAVEISPIAYRYLCMNAFINNLPNIHHICGNSLHNLSGIYDRIHMGHFDAISFLQAALQHVKKGSMLHLHMVTDKGKENEYETIRSMLDDCALEAKLSWHKVKKVHPRAWHTVCDIQIL
ncbi:MAG: SAM-dependent methyltransferase [Methanomicrobiales archaeon]|jgi:tRNA wybutosine-synthesizing protein 2|nr:SAM-dependent methyltransferase [Methanomicrobiales archaeon]